jgi:alpha-methylacyl-CoA racemase
LFDGTDACVAPVLSWSEGAQHPHLRARQSVVVRDGVVQPAPAPRFSRTVTELPGLPPRLGEHSVEVLRDWGIAEADELLACGAIVTAE